MNALLQLSRVNESPSSRSRAIRLLLLTILLRPFGNLSLAWGMKHFPHTLALNPVPYLQAFANPFVALGIALLIVSLLTRMALLSVADLSVVLPLTASGYIISTLLASAFLKEQVTAQLWIGTGLVFAGATLVSSTSIVTTNRHSAGPDA